MRVLGVSRRLAAVVVIAGFGLVASPAAWASSSFFTGVGVGAMAGQRDQVAAAPLADGRVLIAGGMDANSATHRHPLDSAEVFNPATGGFSTTGVGSMSIPRAGAAAAPLPDGRVLIAGGF